jgi:dolichyl-phosphate beta-glucosyltransferase
MAAMPAPSLTIVLPAYNEAARIGPALDELFGYLDRTGPAREGGRSADELGPWQVLVVDDGSSDVTAEIVAARPEAIARDAGAGSAGGEGPSGSLQPRLRLLRRPHAGKGAAVRAGVLDAATDLVIFADADMATPPDQLPLLTEALVANDVALGSRVQPDGSDRRTSQPVHRRLLGRFFHMLAGAWVTGSVPDTQCGFKGFRTPVGHDLFERQKITSIVFDAEVIHLARKRGYRIAVVPVQWSDRRGSRMRVRPGLAVQVAWDLVRIPLVHRGVGRADQPYTASP